MAIARLGRQAKRPYGLGIKMAAVIILGLCFIFVWSMFSSSSSSVVTQRESFDDIAEPVSSNARTKSSGTQSNKKGVQNHGLSKEDKKEKVEPDLGRKDEKKVNGSVALVVKEHKPSKKDGKDVATEKKVKHIKEVDEENDGSKDSEGENSRKEKEDQEEEEVVDGKEEGLDIEGEENGDREGDSDLVEPVDQEFEKLEDESDESRKRGMERKIKGPLFDPKLHYTWRLCSTRSKHNYIPCIDIESGTGKLQSYRHTERSCPRTPLMCLVPLIRGGYGSPVRWPESKLKVYHICGVLIFYIICISIYREIRVCLTFSHGNVLLLVQILYKNVAHPKLAAFVKKHSWMVESGEYLTFPEDQSDFKGGVVHYLESIEEVSFSCSKGLEYFELILQDINTFFDIYNTINRYHPNYPPLLPLLQYRIP